VAGVGFNTKFSMPLWLAGVGAFLLIDHRARPLLRTRWPWITIAVFVPFLAPVLLWNSRHSWVTFLHVREDVGARENGRFVLGNTIDFWLGQMMVVGPVLFVILMLGAAGAIRQHVGTDSGARESRQRRVMLFLLVIAMAVFLPVMITSFRTHPAANWSAASYVTLLVLGAHFLAGRMRYLRWRVVVGVAVASGLLQVAAGHHSELLYPLVSKWNERHPDRPLTARRIDPTWRLHGWAAVGSRVGAHYAKLRPGSLLMAAEYQTVAELAFYVAGQPKTYCVGSYFARGPREPFSQYDIWLDRRLDRELVERTGLRGRDGVYVGEINDDVRGAFAHVDLEPAEVIEIERRGVFVRRLEVWVCRGFKGLEWPGWRGRYNK